MVSRRARTCRPTANDALKIAPTRRPPGSRCRPTAARPADAMQPHCEQSGMPPNWHGVILVEKSAETHSVVCAKMHSSGDSGGSASASISAFGICILRVARLQSRGASR